MSLEAVNPVEPQKEIITIEYLTFWRRTFFSKF